MKPVTILIFLLLIFFKKSDGNEMIKGTFINRAPDIAQPSSYNNISRQVADSLALKAKTAEQKINAYMLLAKLDENDGNMKGCIWYATRADTISNVTLNFSWQAATSVFLAKAFRQLGLLKFSESYLSNAEIANENQLDSHSKIWTKVLVLHEHAFHCFEKDIFIDAKKYLQQAALLINIAHEENSQTILLKATNEMLLGICEMKLGNLIAADLYLNAALERIIAIEDNALKAYIILAKADVEIERNNLTEAFGYLNSLEPYLINSHIEDLKISSYESWSKYYKKSGDMVESLEYKSRVIDIKGQRDRMAKLISDDLIEIFNLKKQYYKDRYTIAIGFILIIVMIAAVCLLYNVKLKPNLNAKNNLEEGKQALLVPVINVARSKTDLRMFKVIDKLENSSAIKTKEINIAKDTEERLYQAFLKQEEKYFFLEKSVTLQQLATCMGTNMRYASYILQKFRSKDFYNYIQSSRIEYIIAKLSTSPELFDYKISFLAEMCGFTSLSRFSIAFKTVTGITPSAFIHFLKGEMDQRK